MDGLLRHFLGENIERLFSTYSINVMGLKNVYYGKGFTGQN